MAINPLDVLAKLGELSELVRLQQTEITELREENIRLKMLVPDSIIETNASEPILDKRTLNVLIELKMFPPKENIDLIASKTESWWMRQRQMGAKSRALLKNWLLFHGKDFLPFHPDNWNNDR